MKMAGSSQPMGGLTVGRACIKMAPLKSARKTAHTTMFVQINFVNCYGLISSLPLCKYYLAVDVDSCDFL